MLFYVAPACLLKRLQESLLSDFFGVFARPRDVLQRAEYHRLVPVHMSSLFAAWTPSRCLLLPGRFPWALRSQWPGSSKVLTCPGRPSLKLPLLSRYTVTA